ncbi:MAG: glycosyltransferase family 2 protein [Rhodospirillales bacterium]|nr:glycosyltransferase family 2 protein [Rhodospirillales bacterium]
MPPLVQVIVLNWNGYADTLRCVASLEQQTYPNFRILVVDNGSTDQSLPALAALGERVRLIRLPENLGYTGGNNVGLRHAFADGAEFAWLFNNDALAEPDVLAKLVAACEADSAIGLAGPAVLESADPGADRTGCGRADLDIPTYGHARDAEQARDWALQCPDRMTVHGTALLVRRQLYEAIGGLDDTLFAY